MPTATTSPSPLWAACALPGDGPEYRFTAARSRIPFRKPFRVLRARIRARRTTRKEAR